MNMCRHAFGSVETKTVIRKQRLCPLWPRRDSLPTQRREKRITASLYCQSGRCRQSSSNASAAHHMARSFIRAPGTQPFASKLLLWSAP